MCSKVYGTYAQARGLGQWKAAYLCISTANDTATVMTVRYTAIYNST